MLPPFFQQFPIRVQDFLHAMKQMGLERNIPNISWETAQYFAETLGKRNINTIYEIGPANGFSTMILGSIKPDAQIYSVEISRHAFEELSCNIATFVGLKNGSIPTAEPAHLSPKITSSINHITLGNHHLYFGDALQLTPHFVTGGSEITGVMPGIHYDKIPCILYDMIFIDGAFRMTLDFFTNTYPLLATGGIMIIDDVVKYRWKMHGFFEFLEQQHILYTITQTDADDGVMVIEKKEHT